MSLDDLFVFSQYLTPQHLLSRAAGKLADTEIPAIRDRFIDWFIKQYQVDMSEALYENPRDYASFNHFFTRPLKEDARTIEQDKKVIISPVDGAISQLGNIEQGRIFQAKGKSFSAEELLGGNIERAQAFMGGKYATIYLSPKDYHRIHMPFPGKLKEMVYVPGKLFSVNPVTTDKVPRLFARNERVVTIWETEFGPMAVVLVGAMIVASIETVWHGLVAPLKRKVKAIDYQTFSEPLTLDKGDELGRFKLGSTVVMLLPPGAAEFEAEMKADRSVRLGEAFAKRV